LWKSFAAGVRIQVVNQEDQHMTEDTRSCGDHRFLIGLLTGSVVGAGVAIWFAPRVASELRRRVTDSAKKLSDRASERYQQVSTRVDEAVDDLTKKGQGVRDNMADAVVRGAHEVERIATAAKADHVTDTRKH
jgi:gas vesicle protein